MNNENIYTDLHNYFQAEKEECRQEGRNEEKIEIASTMIKEGLPLNYHHF